MIEYEKEMVSTEVNESQTITKIDLDSNQKAISKITITKYKYEHNNGELHKKILELPNRMNDKNPSLFWFECVEYLNNFPDKKNIIKKFVEEMLLDRSMKYIIKDNLIESHINGLAYFIEHQNSLNETEIKGVMRNNADNLFVYALMYGKPETLEIINKYKNSKFLKDYGVTTKFLIKEKNIEKLEALIHYCDERNYNNSELIKDCLDGKIEDAQWYNKMIEKYGFDINAIGKRDKISTQIHSFINMVINYPGEAGLTLCKNILMKNGNIIDFTAKNKQYIYSRWYEFNIIEFLLTHLKKDDVVDKVEILNKLSLILEYTNLTEQPFSQITNFLLHPEMISIYYQHKVYDSFFKNKILNSNNFDARVVLKKLLEVDNHFYINIVRNTNNNTINPTTILLQSFYENVDMSRLQLTDSPIYTWGKYQGKRINENTLNFLLEKYSEDIATLPANKLNDFNATLTRILIDKGIDIPAKKTFAMRWIHAFINLGKNIGLFADKKVIEETKPIEKLKTKKIEAVQFNTTLMNQIKDESITKYVDAIQLNAEQYRVLIDSHVHYENEHYINNQLPNFLNKAIENYLYFSTMDEKEAKESVMTQLKLLNQKTFKVLNEALEFEKENAAINGRVISRVINQI